MNETDQRYYPFLGSPVSIPRCHYYPPSEGSDGGSPSGGGGSFGSSIFQSNHHQTEEQGLNYERSQEDTPFIPAGYAFSAVQSPAGRGLALPREHQLPNPLVRAVGIIYRVLRTLTTAKAQRHSQFQWRRSAVRRPHWTVPSLPGQPPPEPEPIIWRRLWPPSTRVCTVGHLAASRLRAPARTAAAPIPKGRSVKFFLAGVS